MQGVQIVVEGVGFLNMAFQPMHGQIHFGQADGGGGFLLAVEGHALHGVQPFMLDEVTGLHKHAARAAGQIGHHAVVGLDDVHQGLHQRRRREEFAVVLGTLHGELHQEVFVDTAKHVASGVAQGFRVKAAQQVFEQFFLETVVVFGQCVGQRRKIGLYGVHGIDQH